MESTSIKLPNKLSELFLVIADSKQDIKLVRKAKNDLFILINGWIWNRIMDVCTSGYVQDETFARTLLNEVWIEIINSSSILLKKLKKASTNNEEENILFIIIDKIIQEKKSIILADEIKYAKHHFLLNEFITKDDNDSFEVIDECNGDTNDKQDIETFDVDEDIQIDVDQDFAELFLEKGIIRINNLSSEDLRSIKRWFTIETGKLSKRDREITLEYFNIKGNRKNLDDKKIAYLCKRWDTTPGNLLKIRSRTITKLKAAFLYYVKQEQGKRERDPGKEGNNRRA